ncbi:hypothetical protein ElyMa_001746100 [Elysia marginata]|uniref:Sushi domain-containing protein n=1 Tax=Elysia marginata TaxID=1093978 RepID=A0AAV4E9W3_9GAST|nr:hypothetical protein ElyMa_001746100 [Elysia marginata]
MLNVLSLYGSLAFSILIVLVSADCSSPEIPNDVYALTTASSGYITGAEFDIVCAPGYGTDTLFHLRCGADGKWLGTWPDCSKKENKAKWWMFLLGMVAVVVLVPCILPRLYFSFIDSSSPRKDWSRRKKTTSVNHGSDRIRMQTVSSQPEPLSVSSQPHHSYNLNAVPLPPIQRLKSHTKTYDDHVTI